MNKFKIYISEVLDKKDILINFRASHNYEILKMGELEAFNRFLRGLTLNIDFMYDKILELGIEFEMLSKKATESQESQFLEDWFEICARECLEQLRKL